MASQHSDEEIPQNPQHDNQDSESSDSEEEQAVSQPKSALKKSAPVAATPTRPYLPGVSRMLQAAPAPCCRAVMLPCDERVPSTDRHCRAT